MSQSRKPIETPLAQRIADFTGGPMTIVVWAAAVFIVTGILVGRAQRFEYVGIARSVLYEVSASTTGTLDNVLVDIYDDVEDGDILATFDAGFVRTRLETATAVAEQLDAELRLARLRVSQGGDPGVADWRDDLRRMEVDVDQRRAEMLALLVEIEGDELEEQRLRLQAERVRLLHRDGVASAQEYDDARLLHGQLQERVDRKRVLLAELEGDLQAAEARRNALAPEHMADEELAALLAPLRRSLDAQLLRIAEIEAERERLVLRSPVRGRVTQVVGGRGEAVPAGMPVVTVAPTFATEIVAYVPETEKLRPDIDKVTIARGADPSMTVESRVLRIGPTIEPLPERLWRRAGVAEYGRALVLAAATPLDLTPGESVRVRFFSGD